MMRLGFYMDHAALSPYRRARSFFPTDMTIDYFPKWA